MWERTSNNKNNRNPTTDQHVIDPISNSFRDEIIRAESRKVFCDVGKKAIIKSILGGSRARGAIVRIGSVESNKMCGRDFHFRFIIRLEVIFSPPPRTGGCKLNSTTRGLAFVYIRGMENPHRSRFLYFQPVANYYLLSDVTYQAFRYCRNISSRRFYFITFVSVAFFFPSLAPPSPVPAAVSSVSWHRGVATTSRLL